jgi:acetylglutamate kinase
MEAIKVIKIGGNSIDDSAALQEFLINFSQIKGPKILVHGGGKLATKLAKQLNVTTEMVAGRRITNAENLDIITMVYAGKINKNIVVALQKNKCNAIGFTGADGNTITSVKRPIKEIDYGFVGDVTQVNIELLEMLLENNITPVFCAITHDKKGQLLNTNADTIAAELAIAFAQKHQTELYYCFDKNGVLLDINDENSVVENINSNTYKELLDAQLIFDGMLPKLNNCFDALNNQVFKIHVGTSEMLFKPNVKHTTIQV